MTKKTIVLGASPNPERYSYKAVHRLLNHNHPVIPMGIKKAELGGLEIESGRPDFKDIHTISMYIAPHRQADYYDYLIALKPKRIIFNPGTENDEFRALCLQNNIEVFEHCTLMMLKEGSF